MKIDPREGSKELVDPLRAMGVSVDLEMLPAGDVQIETRGPKDEPLFVGIEYKTIEDAVASMRNGRAAEQFRGMREYYNICWLLIEGRIARVLPTDEMAVWRHGRWFVLPGRVTYPEFASWTSWMAHGTGMLMWRTGDREETCSWLRSVELSLTTKEWSDHRSHLAVYTPPVEGNPFDPPSLCHRAALAICPGIGQEKAKRVADRFGSVKAMVNATQAEWMTVEGVGKKGAAAIVAAMEAEK